MLKFFILIIFSSAVISCGDDKETGDGLPYYSNYCNWTSWNRLTNESLCEISNRPTCSDNYVLVRYQTREISCAWNGARSLLRNLEKAYCCLQK